MAVLDGAAPEPSEAEEGDISRPTTAASLTGAEEAHQK